MEGYLEERWRGRKGHARSKVWDQFETEVGRICKTEKKSDHPLALVDKFPWDMTVIRNSKDGCGWAEKAGRRFHSQLSLTALT